MTHTPNIPKPGANADRLITGLRSVVVDKLESCPVEVRNLLLWNRRASCGSAKQFEAAIKESCKPKTGFDPLTATMDEIKDHFIAERVKRFGQVRAAVKSLGIGYSGVYARKRGKVGTQELRNRIPAFRDSSLEVAEVGTQELRKRLPAFLISYFIFALSFQASVFSQTRLAAMPQSLAATPAATVAGFNGQITLAWNPTPDVARYSVSYGTNRTALNQSVGVGSKTNVTIKGLAEAFTYYFCAYSYDTNGMESLPSNMVTNFIQPKMAIAAASYAVSMTLPRRTNVIESTTNMTTWRPIHTNTAGGIVTVTRPVLVTGEFFRVK